MTLTWMFQLSGHFSGDDYGPPTADRMPPGSMQVTNLADFANDFMNGPWRLYIVDDTTLDLGEISRGWTMNVVWDDSAPRLSA